MAANQGGIYSVLDDERINGRADFFAGLGAGIDGSWATQIGTLVSSNSEIENYNWLGTVPQMSIWEGEALFQELPNYAAALRNQEYQAGLSVAKADLRRDKTGQISQRMRALGARAARHWEVLLSNLILNSETDGAGTIGGNADLTSQGYDLQALFDTDHSYTGSNFTTDQSNDLSGGVFDITTATAPTVEEAVDVLHEMIGQFYTFKDDQGEPINGDARNFMLMVGTNQLWAPFDRAVSVTNLSGGETNPLAGNRYNVQVVLNPRLSAKTTKVYMFRTDSDIRPFILQEEVGLQVAEEDAGMKAKNVEVMSWATRAAGFGLWQNAVLATLS